MLQLWGRADWWSKVQVAVLQLSPFQLLLQVPEVFLELSMVFQFLLQGCL
jgi:hypothetical protein